MRRRGLFLLLAMAVWSAAALATNAEAQDTVRDDSGFYIRAAAVAAWIEIPHYNPFWDRDPPPPFNNPKERRASLLDSQLQGDGIELAVGKELFNDWFMEARGEFISLDQDVRQTLTANAPYSEVGYFPIDGTRTSAGSIFPANISLEFEWQQTKLELLYGRRFASGAGSITPFAGLWTLHLSQSFDLTYDHPASGTHFDQLDDVQTHYYGLLTGLRLHRTLGKAGLTLEATLGTGLARTRYEARQTFTGEAERNVNEDKNVWAHQGTLEAAVDLSLGRGWLLGVSAGVQYLSYTPEVVCGYKSNNEYGEISHIEKFSTLNSSVGLNLKYRF